MYNSGSSPSLTTVTFENNSAASGGGIYNSSSQPRLTAVTINNNGATQSGGGLYNSNNSSPVLVKATLSGNTAASGGGMYNSQGSSPQIIQTGFYTNTAALGGGMYNDICTQAVHPFLVDVLFNANAATGTSDQARGGGLYNGNCPAELTNVTMVHNQAGVYGGGVFATGTNFLKLHNSLLWGNTASGTIADQQFHGSTAEVSNTTIQQSASDPSPFIDADGVDNLPGTRDDDLHPTYPSTYPDGKVIDGGVESNLPADTYDLDQDGNTLEKLPFDLDGHPRIYADNNLDGTCDPASQLEMDNLDQVDRGAYEAGCWVWHMQTGNNYLVDGRKYRLGFHHEIDDNFHSYHRPDSVDIPTRAFGRKSGEGSAIIWVRRRVRGYRHPDSRGHPAHAGCYLGAGHRRHAGGQRADGASPGCDQLREKLRLLRSASSSRLGTCTTRPCAATWSRSPAAITLACWIPLAISRTNPITYTTQAGLVDLERLLKASAGKSRATWSWASASCGLGRRRRPSRPCARAPSRLRPR